MSQSATGLLKALQTKGLRTFTTADVITLLDMTPTAATQALRRLAAQGLLASLKRGVWVNRMLADLHPYEAITHLSAPWPSYISLYSALSYHGIVEEVPQTVYAVTTGRGGKLKNPLGTYHLHHLPPRLLWGFRLEKQGSASFPMAEPEKAFLDLAYLGLIPRSPLGMPYTRNKRWELDVDKLTTYAKRFRYPPLMNYLRQKLQFAR